MAVEFGAEHLLPILHTAYTDTGEQGNQARKLLDKLQNRPEAWGISSLLNIPTLDVNLRFYAASTLKHKIIHDLRQLGDPEISNLQTYLSQIQSTERIVQVQIQLALAALIIQLPSCENIISGLAFSEGNISFMLLGMIPEQTQNRMIPKKYPISQQTVQIVLDRFLMVLREGSDDQTILEGLGNWIELATEDGAAVSSPHLLQILFNLLVDGEDSVGEVLSNVIYLNSVRVPSREWLEMLGNGLLGLSRSLETELRWSVEVMAEAASSHLDFILANREALLEPVLVILMRGVASSERQIAEATLGSWDLLSDHAGLYSVFHILFQTLITGPHLKYPSAFGSREELDDFRDFRHVIGDTLKTCVRYLGSTEALQVIFEALGVHRDEQTIESLLFVMRTIASAVERRETEMLPKILNILLSPDNSDSGRLRYAKNLVIGCYAEWANAQGRNVVQDLCRYLYFSFSNNSAEEDVLVSAAMALMFMAESNARLFPLELLGEMETVLERVNVKVRGYLCEALGIVHASNHTYSGFVSRVFIPKLSTSAVVVECYGRMMDALKANDFWEDAQVIRTHLELASPVLLRLPLTNESFLDALCAELLPLPVVVEFVRRGYIQQRKAFCIRALAFFISEESKDEVISISAVLRECAGFLIAEDVYEFVRLLSKMIRPDAETVRTVVTPCLADIDQARECASSLSFLVPALPDDLLLTLLLLALPNFPPSNLVELAHNLWKCKRSGMIEQVVMGEEMIEVERHFWVGKLREAAGADRSRALKDAVLQLADLIKRRH